MVYCYDWDPGGHCRGIHDWLFKSLQLILKHDDVIKWKHFPRYWPFVRGIHRSPVNSPHKGQWRGALMFSLICIRINGCVYNGEAGDLRRHRAHYAVTVMKMGLAPDLNQWRIRTKKSQQWPQTLKTDSRHDANFVAVGGTAGFLPCHQYDDKVGILKTLGFQRKVTPPVPFISRVILT